MMTKVKQFFHNKEFRVYFLSILYKLIVVIIGFVNSMLINRCLGVSLRGDYTTITNLANLLQMIINLGIGTAYTSLKRKYPTTIKDIYGTLIVLLLLLYGLIAIPLIICLPTMYKYIIGLSYACSIENIVIFIAIVENIKKKNLINICTAIIHTIILCCAYLFFKNNLDIVLLAVILDHICLIITLLFVYKVLKFNIRLISKDIVFDILKVSIPAMLMNLLMYINYHADVIFLSFMINDSVQVGLYGTAVTLGNMLWIIPDAFKDVLFNRAAKKDNPKEIVLSIICNFIICLVIMVGFIFLGKWFLRFFYGEEFVDAYSLTLMMFLGTFPMILYKLIHPIYIANAHTKAVVIILGISAVLNIVGNVILIPKYLGMGAAIASVVSYAVCGLIFLVIFIKDFKILKKNKGTSGSNK